jgi:hypothetical protein
MRDYAQTIKSEFELTRNFAKTHCGDAMFEIKKTADSLVITRSGKNITSEIHNINDEDLVLFYQRTGDDYENELETDATLNMTFSQTQGAIIGPDMLDYIIISNGSKNYKLIIKQNTGMMYYDYEIDDNEFEGNVVNNKRIDVDLPKAIKKGVLSDTVTLEYTGKSIQPELKYDARYIKIGGVYRAIAPGEYEIIFTLKDPYTTKWSDGTTEPKRLKWYIDD